MAEALEVSSTPLLGGSSSSPGYGGAADATTSSSSSSSSSMPAADGGGREVKVGNGSGGRNRGNEDGGPGFLSLDFDRIVNSYSIAAVRARNESKRVKDLVDDEKRTGKRAKSLPSPSPSSSSSKTRKEADQVISDRGFALSRWTLTFVVGLCTGLTAVAIICAVEALIDVRVGFLNRRLQWATGHADADEMAHFYPRRFGGKVEELFDALTRGEFGVAAVCAGYATYNLLLVWVSTALCVFLSPEAAGSGIPEVKAYLNGVRVGLFDDVHLFWTKLVGTIFAVASGLVVGPEGPVVHLGAILGALTTKTGDLELAARNFRVRHPGASAVLGCADKRGIDVLEVRDLPPKRRGRRGRGKLNDSQDEEEGSAMDSSSKSSRPSWGNNLFSSLFFHLSHFRNDLERRHLVSVGAAAGFASAFGAPVGGLLYSMEEASSFFAHDMLWRTLFGTAVATCCIAIYHGDFTRYCMLSLEIGVQEESLLTRFNEVPLYVIMGAMGGVVGTMFNNAFHFMNHHRKHFYGRLTKDRRAYCCCKMLESGLVSILTSTLMLAIPLNARWACRPLEVEDEDEEFDPGFTRRYNCPPGEINEIGSILFGSREESIKDILTNPAEFEPATLLAVGLIFLGLMMITFGIAIPQGMFMPTVLTGASLGGYAGLEFQRHFVSSVHPSDFAIIGAAAFLAGMQRNTVSLCVILMEGTGQTKAIIPVIITVVCARLVGDLLSEGIYEIGMELKGYPYLVHTGRDRYDMFVASDVMTADFDTVAEVETAGAIESLLLNSDHHAFPVVDGETGDYRGMVRRDQLIAALQCKIFVETIAGTGVEETERSICKGSGVRVRFPEEDEEGSDDDDDEEGQEDPVHPGGTLRRRYSSARRLPRLDDDVYSSQRDLALSDTMPDWDPNKPELVSPWLRDNVMTTSNSGDEVMFGMDETLPNGRIQTHNGAVVRVIRNKFVAFVSPDEKDMRVDVGLIMNRAALSVLAEHPLSKTYDLFVSMGLRHLPVLGEGRRVVGMITRTNLGSKFVRDRVGYELYHD